MSHSFVCLTVHLVFHIKSTAPCFRQEDLETVWKYIAGTIHRLGANALQVGGVSDHVHILCTLPRDISVASFVEKIKGGSSRWIKTLSPYYQLFYWQGATECFPLVHKTATLSATTFYTKRNTTTKFRFAKNIFRSSMLKASLPTNTGESSSNILLCRT